MGSAPDEETVLWSPKSSNLMGGVQSSQNVESTPAPPPPGPFHDQSAPPEHYDMWQHISDELTPTTKMMLRRTSTFFRDNISFRQGEETRMLLEEEIAGDLELLKWSYQEKRWDCTTETSRIVAYKGNLDAFKWLHTERKCPLDERVFIAGVKSNNVDLVAYLISIKCPLDLFVALVTAAEESTVEMLKLLQDLNPDPKFLQAAARQAAGLGKLDNLKYLFTLTFQVDADMCTQASYHGQLAALQWLHEQANVPWNTWTLAMAARNGYSSIVKYLLDQGCPSDKWACAEAAYHGRLGTLAYLRIRGVEWDEWTIMMAQRGGQNTVVNWALSAGCPAPANPEPLDVWYESNHTMQWYIENNLWEFIQGRIVVFRNGFYKGKKGRVLHLQGSTTAYHTSFDGQIHYMSNRMIVLSYTY